MPHALQIFSDSYKVIDPIFSKRCRQLYRSLEHCKVAANKAAANRNTSADLYTALREFARDHKAFVEAYTSRPQQLFFPNAEQLLPDMEQLKRLDKYVKPALSGQDTEAMVTIVQELMNVR